MLLTHKDRLHRALSFEPVDRLPTQINYTHSMGKQIADHFQVSLDRLPFTLDNHLLRVDLSYPVKMSQDSRTVFDWWGAGHDRGEEGYHIRVSPLAGSKVLESFPWPDPYAPDLLTDAQKVVEEFGGEYFIVPNFGFALFERAWTLRGFENLFTDIALDRGFVAALMDRITEIQLVLIHRFIELGVDGAYFGDDYGAQNGLLISPASWRQLIKPRLARMFAPFTERGLPVLMHSDGQIQKILPDLVEIGLTALNPVQPEVMDHKWLYENYGGKLSFYGGISTQTVLPQGTPADVLSAVKDCTASLAPERTGLLLAPSHRLMTDVPIGNIEAMLSAFRQSSSS